MCCLFYGITNAGLSEVRGGMRGPVLESDPYRALHHLNHDSLNVPYFPPPSPSTYAPSPSHLLIHFLHFMYVQHKVRTYKEYHSVCPSSELGLPPNPPPAG